MENSENSSNAPKKIRSKRNIVKSELTCTIFAKEYWKEASKELASTKTLVFAALIIALRVAVKAARIPIAAGLSVTFDSYVNSLGSLVYGPVVGLMVGAISDTIGVVLFPSNSGPYFFPFILTEMSSSFIFALFFWRRKINVFRVLTAKFTVNLICNITLTSLLMKWMYIFFGDTRAQTYHIINLVRIAKNLVMFPIESVFIVVVLGTFIPILKRIGVIPATQGDLILKKKHIFIVAIMTVLSILLVIFYITFLKDFLSAHNIKFL